MKHNSSTEEAADFCIPYHPDTPFFANCIIWTTLFFPEVVCSVKKQFRPSKLKNGKNGEIIGDEHEAQP
jgi:hypothetical protein